MENLFKKYPILVLVVGLVLSLVVEVVVVVVLMLLVVMVMLLVSKIILVLNWLFEKISSLTFEAIFSA